MNEENDVFKIGDEVTYIHFHDDKQKFRILSITKEGRYIYYHLVSEIDFLFEFTFFYVPHQFIRKIV